MRFISKTGFLLALLISGSATAHVKWFVPLTEKIPANFQWYGWHDSVAQLWIVIALILIGCSLYLDRHLPTPTINEATALKTLAWVLRICLGLSLVLNATNAALIAPHYSWSGPFAQGLLGLEVLVGLLMFTPWVQYASAGLLLLYLGVGLHYGVEVIEYLNIAGAAFFLGCLYIPELQWRTRLQPYALPVLRIMTGVALVWLAFSEKLLRPDYAEKFLETYMWNFMQKIGFANFSDRLFVLSAGTMEAVFGIILMMGSTTRLNIFVVSAFMLTSNLTFVIEGDYREAFIEVIGHMPIIATALLFLLLGSGHKWKLSSWLRQRFN